MSWKIVVKHYKKKVKSLSLREAYNGENSFADPLEAFGGGQDDPISVSIGGPIMSKFINAFRQIASYKSCFVHKWSMC